MGAFGSYSLNVTQAMHSLFLQFDAPEEMVAIDCNCMWKLSLHLLASPVAYASQLLNTYPINCIFVHVNLLAPAEFMHCLQASHAGCLSYPFPKHEQQGQEMVCHCRLNLRYEKEHPCVW